MTKFDQNQSNNVSSRAIRSVARGKKIKKETVVIQKPFLECIKIWHFQSQIAFVDKINNWYSQGGPMFIREIQGKIRRDYSLH